MKVKKNSNLKNFYFYLLSLLPPRYWYADTNTGIDTQITPGQSLSQLKSLNFFSELATHIGKALLLTLKKKCPSIAISESVKATSLPANVGLLRNRGAYLKLAVIILNI